MVDHTNVEANVTLGVDTHKDNHVAVALDGLGRHLGTLSVPTTTAGYRKLLGYIRGNRDANRALYVVAFGRMSRDERTKAYVARRTAEGKSKKEIIRCLKRYIARELYRILTSPLRSPLRASPTLSAT